jgi:hypothetical protein
MPSKYTTMQKKEVVRPWRIHPIWRGIGFLMMVLVPIMSGAAAVLITQFGFKAKWPFMYEMTGAVHLPDILYKIPVLSMLARWISSIPNFKAVFLFFIAGMLVFSGVLSLIYAMVYRMIGPPRYTALDAPASKVRTKRYTR